MTIVIDLLADGSRPAVATAGPYANALAYMARYGWTEGVQLLADEAQLLTEQLLRDAIAVLDGVGTWTGAPTGPQQQAGLAAATRLQEQLVNSTNFMDGYLRARVSLPIATDDANAGTLRDCCMALARVGLADDSDNATERMDATAATWRKWLVDVSQGKVQLIGATGEPMAGSSGVITGQVRSGYDWGSFGGVR